VSDILNMEAGPELDRLIAEKVMGWKFVPDAIYCAIRQPCFVEESGYKRLPCDFRPSEDISAAFHAAEEMRKRKLFLALGNDEGGYCAVFSEKMRPFQAFAETAPLAICRAALLAIGGTP